MEPTQLEQLKHHRAVRPADSCALRRHQFWQPGCVKVSPSTGAVALSFVASAEQYRNAFEAFEGTVKYALSRSAIASQRLAGLENRVVDLVIVQPPGGPHLWAPVHVGPVQQGWVPLTLLPYCQKGLFARDVRA